MIEILGWAWYIWALYALAIGLVMFVAYVWGYDRGRSAGANEVMRLDAEADDR